VVKSQVNHTIRLGRAAFQAFQVFKGTSMHLGAGRGERLCSRIGSGETDHLMARINQLGDEGGTDKTGGTSNEDTHDYFSFSLLNHLARAELSLARLEFGVQLVLVKAATSLRRQLAPLRWCTSPRMRGRRRPWRPPPDVRTASSD